MKYMSLHYSKMIKMMNANCKLRRTWDSSFGMGKRWLVLCLALFCGMQQSWADNTDPIVFADANVKAICVANWDGNGDGELSYAEAAVVTELGYVFRGNTTITSFDELQYFTGLTTITSGNNTTSDAGAFGGCSSLLTIVLPNAITSIGSYAFINCNALTTFEIPNSVTSVGDYAFFGCSGLNSVIIGNSVTSIGMRAFNSCVGLTSLALSNSVTSIGHGAFAGCTGLTGELVVPNSMSSIGSSAFENCTGLSGLVIPNSVTSIGSTAFKNCTGLSGLVIPNSVTSIGADAFNGCSGLMGELIIPSAKTELRAFSNCSGLTSVIIGNSVASIGERVFLGCSSLATVTIGEGVRSIGRRAFWDCPALETLHFNAVNCSSWYSYLDNETIFNSSSSSDGGIPLVNLTIGNNVQQIPERAFYHCYGLTGELVIPNSVASIGNNAFVACSGLTSLVIGNSATWSNAGIYFPFSSCSGLQQISVASTNTAYDSRDNCNAIIETSTNKLLLGCENTMIPNTVTSIGNMAFRGCAGLTSIEIPNSITSIGSYSFQNCIGLSSVVIPNSVTSIGEYAFGGCSGLEAISIGNSVTTIGTRAFTECSGLISVVIPNSVTTIGSGAFVNCSGLISVVIPNSVTTIEGAAFWNCSGLTSLTIGEGVTTIGGSAFDGCSGINSMTCFAETPPSVQSSSFTSVNRSIPLSVPCGSKTAYEAASYWNEFTNINELCPFEVTADANPINGGIVTGAGSYFSYEECTLAATANPGYLFLNWTKDGEVVSTEDTYTFTVTEDCALTANFWAIENHWSMPEGYADNMTITGTVNIDGVESASDFIELAAFIGEECRGTALPMQLGGQRIYFLIVMGNAADENAALNFKLYDHQLQQELDYYCTNELNYQSDLALGLDEFYAFDFLTPVTITATADPVEGGSIEGTGLHFPSLEATLTAIPATGYHFVNWTKDGAEVSTEAAYTFAVSTDESYVAHFVLNTYDITAMAEPAEGGAVDGAGAYNHFETCTLTAIANEGYTFVNWTENGEPVSESATYEFEVDGARTLVANFSLNSYEIAVTASPSEGGSVTGEGTYYHFATCTLTATAATGYTFENWTLNDEVVSTEAAFTVEVSGAATYVAHFNLNSYEIVAIASPSDGGIIEGAGTYNHFQTCTLTATANEGFLFNGWVVDGETVSTNTSYTIEVSGPVTITALFYLVQAVELNQGWTWWGTSVEQSGIDGLSMLENSLTPNGRVIKTSNAFVQYNATLGWIGSLANVGITNEAGYRIQTVAACETSITGPVADPENHPITIRENWTWIGYPVSHSQSVASALAGFEPEVNDIIKNQGGSARYLSSGWVPPTFTLNPGESYMYYSRSTEEKELVFGDNGGMVKAEPDDRYWQTNIHAFADNLCLLAVVEIDGEEQREQTLELGAFVNGECRGSAKLMYVEPFDRYYAMMNVMGVDGDVIEFAVVNGNGETTSWESQTRLTFVTDDIVGEFDKPFVVAFGSLSSVYESFGRMGIYPNPVNRDELFSLLIPEDEKVAELVVMNAMGSVVRHEKGVLPKHTAGLSVAGVYMVRVTCQSGRVYQGRIVVK